jgi:hypothetical protein
MCNKVIDFPEELFHQRQRNRVFPRGVEKMRLKPGLGMECGCPRSEAWWGK